MSNALTQNKAGFAPPVERDESALGTAQLHKAVQEIQAALTIAAARPRDQMRSYERIMQACKRPTLADQALYAYPRGNQTVTGPSIRLAEVVAQNWGNISFGIREISQNNGVSEVEAFAWDLETNTQSTKIFHVKHERDTKQGKKKLTDSRDIYEMVANQGARRLRACILAVIPGDIIDDALSACEETQKGGKEPLIDRVKKMVSLFNDVGVQAEHIEKRLGHRLDAIIEAELVTLRSIYKSLKDGMAKREDFFDIAGATSEGLDSVKDLVANKGKPNIVPPTATKTAAADAPIDVDPETGEILPPHLQG